jgi:hypothetical protein
MVRKIKQKQTVKQAVKQTVKVIVGDVKKPRKTKVRKVIRQASEFITRPIYNIVNQPAPTPSILDQSAIKKEYTGSIQGLLDFVRRYDIVDKDLNTKPKQDLEAKLIEDDIIKPKKLDYDEVSDGSSTPIRPLDMPMLSRSISSKSRTEGPSKNELIQMIVSYNNTLPQGSKGLSKKGTKVELESRLRKQGLL